MLKPIVFKITIVYWLKLSNSSQYSYSYDIYEKKKTNGVYDVIL